MEPMVKGYLLSPSGEPKHAVLAEIEALLSISGEASIPKSRETAFLN